MVVGWTWLTRLAPGGAGYGRGHRGDSLPWGGAAFPARQTWLGFWPHHPTPGPLGHVTCLSWVPHEPTEIKIWVRVVDLGDDSGKHCKRVVM